MDGCEFAVRGILSKMTHGINVATGIHGGMVSVPRHMNMFHVNHRAELTCSAPQHGKQTITAHVLTCTSMSQNETTSASSQQLFCTQISPAQ
jgi:hypothetical protein